jgi:hypothetical protein
MRIQYISDLHLEYNTQSIIPGTSLSEYDDLLVPTAPILALLGDIGDPDNPSLEHFLQWATARWSQVLYVPGNHEFWRLKPGSTKTIESAMKRLYDFEKKYKNLCIMWRTKLMSEDGVLILGCPLWSRPAEGVVPHESERAWIDRDNTFDRETLINLHKADLEWLKKEIRAAPMKQPIVVLTHYAPSLMLISRDYVGKPESTLYASDLDYLIRPPVVAWACGHVHQVVNWKKGWNTADGESGYVLILTNPRGYKKDKSGFRRDAVLRIDPSSYTSLPTAEELLD